MTIYMLDLGTQSESASTLQNAGSIAAIIGASIALILFLAGIVRWWWRRRNWPGLRVLIHYYRGAPHVRVFGLPPWTQQVTAYVSDGTLNKRLGPDPRRADLEADYGEQHLFGLNTVGSQLDESVRHFQVEVFATSPTGEVRRVFKGRVKNEIATRIIEEDRPEVLSQRSSS